MPIEVGTIRMDAGTVVIDCLPHVRIKLKRLLPGVKQDGVTGELSVKLTDDIARDLEWVLDRYPMRCEDGGAIMVGSARHQAVEDSVARILRGEIPNRIELALPPREYQQQGAAVAYATQGLLVADELGVGKTVTAITLLAYPGVLPALVVCPAHLRLQWQREIGRFAPALKVHVATKSRPYDVEADVLVMSYHAMSGWADALAGRIRLVVFDEAQELRHHTTVRHTCASLLARGAGWRLGLSATPIYNYGSEFHSVMDVIRPDVLGTRTEFLQQWCAAEGFGDKAKVKDPAALGSFLREAGALLRRTRVEVRREVPDITRVVQEVDADLGKLAEIEEEATALATKIVKLRRRDLADAMAEAADKAARGEVMQAGGQLSTLLRHATGVAKAPAVAEFVKIVVEQSGPVVLFGWHLDVYEIWRRKLADLKPVFYTGKESATQKAKAVEEFVSGRSQVIIVSLRSGAGLDGLQQRSSNVVFGELDWSPGVLEQCEGRVHRDGQESPVFVYYVTSDAGCDPAMVDMLGVKRGQLRGVVGDPSTEGVVDPDRARRLAEDYLARRAAAVA